MLCLFALFFSTASPGSAPASNSLINKQDTLDRQTFWTNRDFDWFKKNIPFFESPDADIDLTYYYRWELITRHLVYGSPETGYTYTEFMDRPSWSGTYGAISCAAGHHLYETRWLKDPHYAQDYARYWFHTPGAQPRNYSAWLADGVWAVYKVQRDKEFAIGLRNDLVENYKGWEQEHYVPSVGMFWQTGMADGMETNINSRQTVDTFAGAQGYRPTLNSYMYADARAISSISNLMGDARTADVYRKKAAELKRLVQDKLWDKRRTFFMHMFKNDEKDGVKALTRTYDTGKYAGNEHGREEIGYVPWEFELPDPGYEAAWKYLMDRDYFMSPYGPTVTERNDPLFLIAKNCCVWSGQSWPYATTQTLQAMANLLNDYKQSVVKKADYFKLLKIYTLTQRKNSKPYIAESANPDTGSWEGSDNFNHSEHYFHSGYVDLIITGLAGLRPRADDTLEVNPLAPDSWSYFALDDVLYHGHNVSIVWDKTGTRYHRGTGFMLFVDGRKTASSPTLARLTAKLKPRALPAPAPSLVNFAVNNEGSFFPRVTASFSDPETPISKLNDGNYWYDISPPNRWSSKGSGSANDWCAVQFGIERPVSMVKLYILDDGAGSAIQAPAAISLEYKSAGNKAWLPIPGVIAQYAAPVGRCANSYTFPVINASAIRATFINRTGAYSGLTEFEVWGASTLPLPQPTVKPGNLALNRSGVGYPIASASFTSRFDRVQEVNDGISLFSANPRNRWTAYDSPNKTDWVAIDFGSEKMIDLLVLHIYGDGGGVQAPAAYNVQIWNGADWLDAINQKRTPEKPLASAINTVTFQPVKARKVRVVFTHAGRSFSGLTELEVWGESQHPDD
jgi:hypothetical protein